MDTGNEPGTTRGIVLSDLHLLTRRSRGQDCIDSLRADLAAAGVLVLNGDVFDFRWSTLRNLETSVDAAVSWLRNLSGDFPRCEIHYVLGNHDCLTLFRERLPALASSLPRLHWHEHGLRLDGALFLHGDCADERTDLAGLCRRRESWETDRQRGAAAAAAYCALDHLGITRFLLTRHYPRDQTVGRVVHYLDRSWPDWRRTTRDCYFGHTHLPFSGHQHDGVNFHNTGSGIRGMSFNPIRFETRGAPAETLSASHRHVHAD